MSLLPPEVSSVNQANSPSVAYPQWFKGKRFTLGVTGGIAAYKSGDAIRLLQKHGAEKVFPILTPNACNYITPLTLSSLAMEPATADHLAVTPTGVPLHIHYAQQSDAMLLLPATANSIAKITHGLADELVSCTALTFTDKPLILCPTMNTRMWENPITQHNLSLLQRLLPTVVIVPPASAMLACGEQGVGHLASWESILLHTYRAIHPHATSLQGKRVLITAGGTHEPIDVARVISNRSSGKMGLALADEAYARGAEVTLLYANAPLPERPYRIEATPTVQHLLETAQALFPTCDYLIKAAAVSDFTPSHPSQYKLKKQEGQDRYSFEFSLTPDILATLCQQKQAHQTVVGFAAESHLNSSELYAKLKRKGCDWLAVNNVARADIGFASNDNELLLLSKDANHPPLTLPKQSKTELAFALWQQLL
ncbi:MAG: bifunctional phosphopantothenoylcysteine decarboxylase/phosphopantothenate--cysteine ligase CoaBC [Vampirovibrionales bacterium]